MITIGHHPARRYTRRTLPGTPAGRSASGRGRPQEQAGEPPTPAVRTYINPGLTCIPRHSTMTECT